MPILPLIADPASYRPCIQDLLADGEAVRDYWLGVFETHVNTWAELPVGDRHLADMPQWPALKRDYLEGLAALRANPGLRGRLSVLELTIYREEQFLAHGLPDPFVAMKRRADDTALRTLPDLLRELDALPRSQRGERLAHGLFAGNLFDMGSEAAVDAFRDNGLDFFAMRDNVRPRPWAVDDLDAWLARVGDGSPPYRQALFFVDNTGPDIVLGAIPLARELATDGIRVVLAANSKPALNDVTAEELREILDRCSKLDDRTAVLLRDDRIAVVESGCHSPLIDLANVSPPCCAAAEASDLLVLEGMGRAIESNYDARFTVDTLKVALIKDKMVAEVLGVKLFDPVFRFETPD